MNIDIKYRVYLFLIFFIFSGTVMFAQSSLTLQDAITKGLENNFQIRIFKGYQEISELSNNWGTVGRYPSISLGATSLNRYDDAPNRVTGDREKYYTNTLSPYVGVNWLLFNGFSVKMNKDKLELLENLSVGNTELIIENTLQAIILGYYKVLLEEEKLEVLGAVKKLSGDRYKYEETRKEFGSAVTFDVLQAKNSYLSDSSNYFLQKLNIKNAYLNLNLLLGEPPDSSFILVDSFAVEKNNYLLDDLMTKMKASNKTLMNQYINQEILQKEISIEKSRLYPSLSLNAGADFATSRLKYQDIDAYKGNSFDYYANFTLSFNLYNGGNTRRAIETAEISQRIGDIETKQLEQTLDNYLLNQFDL